MIEDEKAVREELAAFLDRHIDRLKQNLGRVHSLVFLSEHMIPKGQDKFAVQKEDLLRAAVVFLHATLEDFLRYVGSIYLPRAKEDVLNHIPLIGIGDRAEKFLLGRLAQHRDKSVNDLIAESIESHLQCVSFSKTTDVARFLEAIGVKSDLLTPHYPALANLIERRHQIVHRADLIDTGDGTARQPTPIAPSTVEEWIKSVRGFCSAVVADCVRLDFGPQLDSLKRRAEAAPQGDTQPCD